MEEGAIDAAIRWTLVHSLLFDRGMRKPIALCTYTINPPLSYLTLHSMKYNDRGEYNEKISTTTL